MPSDNIFSSPKVRITLILGVVLLLVGAFLWWWLNRQPATVVLQPQPVTPSTNTTNNSVPDITSVVSPEGAELSVTSRNFVERYGSFSNQSNKQNIRDVWSLLTPAMQNRLSLTPTPTGDGGYVGIESRVVGMTVISESDTAAELRVKAQRIERSADLQEKVYYQDMVISLVKSGDQWLVDRAEWQ